MALVLEQAEIWREAEQCPRVGQCSRKVRIYEVEGASLFFEQEVQYGLHSIKKNTHTHKSVNK